MPNSNKEWNIFDWFLLDEIHFKGKPIYFTREDYEKLLNSPYPKWDGKRISSKKSIAPDYKQGDYQIIFDTPYGDAVIAYWNQYDKQLTPVGEHFSPPLSWWLENNGYIKNNPSFFSKVLQYFKQPI